MDGRDIQLISAASTKTNMNGTVLMKGHDGVREACSKVLRIEGYHP